MINLRIPLNDQLGYGIVATNLLKELSIYDDITLFPIGQPNYSNQSIMPLVQKCVENQNNFDCKAPTLTIWHQFQCAERIGSGRNVFLTFFELDRLTEREKRHLDTQDIIIQPSEWGSNIIKKSLPLKDIRVINMGVDTNFYQPINLNMDKPYRFLMVGKNEIRKGHDILHELFNSAFSSDDDVELYLSWNNPFISELEIKKWEDMYKTTPLGNKIHFVSRKIDIRSEYAAADCGIFPSRSESIGLPILEMMSMNKPVITLNYGGVSAFCNKQNSYLVDVDEVESANDNIWFHGDGNWAKIGPKQEIELIENMRFCYQNKINTNPAGRQTAERLDWKQVTKQVLEVLSVNA